MTIPSDPYVLLSWINTRLRDEGEELSELCAALELDEKQLCQTLAQAGFTYLPLQRRFG